jgi:hypothetical protein
LGSGCADPEFASGDTGGQAAEGDRGDDDGEHHRDERARVEAGVFEFDRERGDNSGCDDPARCSLKSVM